jgi:OmpA-OmpF porin, OOP family
VSFHTTLNGRVGTNPVAVGGRPVRSSRPPSAAPNKEIRHVNGTSLAALALAALALAAGCSPAPAAGPPRTAANGPVDVDEDHIPDEVDECITEKEDGLAPKPSDGCRTNPDDPDGDNVAQLDKCPTEPESVNGFEDEDGCPDKLPEVVVDIKKQELRCDAKILFAKDRADIASASAELVGNVAQALKDHPEIQFVEVAGHADVSGNDVHNVALTRLRAQSVVEALVARGVDARRLRAAGYGSYCPLDPGATDEARDVNRRVEFKVMLRSGQETGVSVGCSAAESHGIKPDGVPASAPRQGDISGKTST